MLFRSIFAIESFMDELAEDAGSDPIEFRLRHLGDARARAVLEDVMEISGWEFCRSDRTDTEGDVARGTGVALARYKGSGCYVAVVCEGRRRSKVFFYLIELYRCSSWQPGSTCRHPDWGW